MKKLLLLLLCVPLIGFGQGETIKTYYDNGQLKSEENYKDGNWTYWRCWDKEGDEIECK